MALASLQTLYANLKTLLNKTYVQIQQPTSDKDKIVITNSNGQIQCASEIPWSKISNIPSAGASTAGIIKLDTTPTQNHTDATVTSNGIHTALSGKADTHNHPYVAIDQGANNKGTFLKVGNDGKVGCASITIPSVITYTAGTGLTLSNSNQFSLTNASDYIKKSTTTSGYIKNDGTIGTPTDTKYTAGTGLTLSNSNQFSLTNASDYIKKSTTTSGYIKNDGTIGTPTDTKYTADDNTLQLSNNNQFSVKTIPYSKLSGVAPTAHTHGWDEKHNTSAWQFYINEALGLAYVRVNQQIPGTDRMANGQNCDFYTLIIDNIKYGAIHGTALPTISPYLAAWVSYDGVITAYTSNRDSLPKNENNQPMVTFSGVFPYEIRTVS